MRSQLHLIARDGYDSSGWRPPDTTAPVLTLAMIIATGTAAGAATANIAAKSNEAGGTLYWGVYADTTGLTYADVVAGTGAARHGSVTNHVANVSKTVAVTGLAPSTAYWSAWAQADAAGNHSNVLVSAASATTDSIADTTAPVLSAGSITETGDTTATLSVTSNETGGTLYWSVVTSTFGKTYADVVAGTGAAAHGSLTNHVAGTPKTILATGLAAGTTYWAMFAQADAAGNHSNVLNSAASATTTGGGVNVAPAITSNGGGSTAAVNAAENQTAVTTVTATDANVGDTLTYSIIGGADAAKFAINSSSGVLTFLSAPNREAPTDANADNIYVVTVQVSDGMLTDSQTISVTVTNVNEPPVITSNGGGATAAINVADGQTAVTTVVATDVDVGTTKTFSIIGGADAAKFSINSSTGVLTFIDPPDFSTPGDVGGDNVYNVTVQVSDGALTDSQAISVTITSVNLAPSITSNGGGSTAAVNVVAGSTAVTTVTATDPNVTDNLAFSIIGGADSARFDIDAVTGALTFLSPPMMHVETPLIFEQFSGVPDTNIWQVSGNWVGTGGNQLQLANTTFSGGQMHLKVPAGLPLRGAELQSLTTPGYSYGFYAARIKTANVHNGGVVSFFWIEQPDYGPHEWDIEFTLSDSWAGTSNNGRVSFTTHPLDNTQWVNLGFNPSEDFHEYGFLWTPGQIQFTVDGVIVRTVVNAVLNTNALGYIMMNTWSGISNFGGGPPVVDAISHYDSVKFYPGATSVIDASANTDNIYEVIVQVSDGLLTDSQTISATITAPVSFTWPDATNTGPRGGHVLTAYSGPTTINTANTTISDKIISEAIEINAAHVTITDCIITYNDFFGISVTTLGANVTVQYCKITGPGMSGDSPAVISCDVGGSTFTANDISGGEHGIAFGPGTAVATKNYLHGGGSNKADPHIGGFSLKGGQNGITIQDNYVTGNDLATSDVFIQANTDAINDVVVNHNKLVGNPGSAIYVEGRLGFPCTNVHISNNIITEGQNGWYSVNTATPTFLNNVDAVTGNPIPDP